MADTNKADTSADTVILPSREQATRKDPVLGGHEIFRTLMDEKMGPVKSLGEAGLTKIVVTFQNRKGVLRSHTHLVSHETCEAVISLLQEEQLG